MNKFLNYIFALTAVVALGFLSSCSDDDETTPSGPSISLSTSDGENESDFSGYVGDSVGWTINVNAPAGFNTLRIYRQEDGVKGNSPLKTFSKTSGTNPTDFEEDFGYIIQEEDINSTIYLIFEAIDENGSVSTLEYEVKAQVKPTIKYEMRLLYAPNSNLNSKTFFSTNDGQTYSVNDILGTVESISPKIDFGYFYGTNFKATIASPNEYPINYGQNGWNSRNATKIKKTDLSASAFLELENDVDGINKAFEDAEYGPNNEQARNLTVGEVLAFELVTAKGEKRGLIKVNGIDGTDGLEAHITLDVVVID